RGHGARRRAGGREAGRGRGGDGREAGWSSAADGHEAERGRAGRRGRPVSGGVAAPGGALTIGIDVGGTKVAGGVVDEQGRVLAQTRGDTPATDAVRIRGVIVDMVREL